MVAGGRPTTKTETLSTLYDGKLRLERRNGAPWIFARTHLQGKYIVRSTREQTLPAATRVATDWYLELRDRIRKGESLHGRSFAQIHPRHRLPASGPARRPVPVLKETSMRM